LVFWRHYYPKDIHHKLCISQNLHKFILLIIYVHVCIRRAWRGIRLNYKYFKNYKFFTSHHSEPLLDIPAASPDLLITRKSYTVGNCAFLLSDSSNTYRTLINAALTKHCARLFLPYQTELLEARVQGLHPASWFQS
jgi:hypothetical protein